MTLSHVVRRETTQYPSMESPKGSFNAKRTRNSNEEIPNKRDTGSNYDLVTFNKRKSHHRFGEAAQHLANIKNQSALVFGSSKKAKDQRTLRKFCRLKIDGRIFHIGVFTLVRHRLFVFGANGRSGQEGNSVNLPASSDVHRKRLTATKRSETPNSMRKMLNCHFRFFCLETSPRPFAVPVIYVGVLNHAVCLCWCCHG